MQSVAATLLVAVALVTYALALMRLQRREAQRRDSAAAVQVIRHFFRTLHVDAAAKAARKLRIGDAKVVVVDRATGAMLNGEPSDEDMRVMDAVEAPTRNSTEHGRVATADGSYSVTTAGLSDSVWSIIYTEEGP